MDSLLLTEPYLVLWYDGAGKARVNSAKFISSIHWKSATTCRHLSDLVMQAEDSYQVHVLIALNY